MFTLTVADAQRIQALGMSVVMASDDGDMVYRPRNTDFTIAIAGYVFARSTWNLQTRWDVLEHDSLPEHVWFRDGDRTNLLPSNLTINRTAANVKVKVWFP